MTMTNRTMCSTAIAAVLSLPLALGPVWAQQSQENGQAGEATTQSQDTASTQNGEQTAKNAEQSAEAESSQDMGQQQAREQSSQSAAGASGSASKAPDTLVATVGEAEIRGSDVMMVIGMLPPQLQSQSPQMLVPIALEQLILRELALEKARGQNLAEDPEVIALVTGATQTAEDDAMVQVWLDRELAKAVTDEAVQTSYDEAKACRVLGRESSGSRRRQVQYLMRLSRGSRASTLMSISFQLRC
ncbi:hypothetical protein [uncultured Paracoccus sp.]|uniref:hypothetical protein n=1 Tax=uncultured Paracoccus sp. TaxID=189685 RepID=UPI002632EC7D|nr:hypothetical protein [uncultured Paracoccus sp.]